MSLSKIQGHNKVWNPKDIGLIQPLIGSTTENSANGISPTQWRNLGLGTYEFTINVVVNSGGSPVCQNEDSDESVDWSYLIDCT